MKMKVRIPDPYKRRGKRKLKALKRALRKGDWTVMKFETWDDENPPIISRVTLVGQGLLLEDVE